jgi:hypothetical protein
VSAANSIVGSTAGDAVGLQVAALANGHYIVGSPSWDSPFFANVGAVTWATGTGPTALTVSSTNSLVGASPDDSISSSGLYPLTNGNYVVASAVWNRGGIVDAGAATLGNGNGGTTGLVSAANSLVGTVASDVVGVGGVVALTSGDYVVASPQWDAGGTSLVGAVTYGSGATGISGLVTVTNSLIGTSQGDSVGWIVVALANGNFVVGSPFWDNGPIGNVGAVTLRRAADGTFGTVTAANSLIGSAALDQVGQRIVALTDGNFVVTTPTWDNGAIVDAGAATWRDGSVVAPGTVTAGNSLVGTRTSDRVGVQGALALPGGSYVVGSISWDHGTIVDAGAVTWLAGGGPSAAVVSGANSLVGASTDDRVPGVMRSHTGGAISILTTRTDNAGVVDVGAVTLLAGGPLSGSVSPANSVFGMAPGAGIKMQVSETFTRGEALVVGRPAENLVSLLGLTDYVSLPPARLLDTRPGATTVDGLDAGTGLLAAGATYELPVGGRGGLSPFPAVVAVNVTAVDALVAGFITVHPCTTPRPTASNLNYTPGAIVPNAVLATVGPNGRVCLYTSQPTHLVVDVNGYFPGASTIRPLAPARLIDTRPGEPTIDGQQAGLGRRSSATVTEIQVTGRAGVPAGASSVALNVTVTETTAEGYVTVYPCGGAPPTASNLNHGPGQTIANLVVTRIGSGGRVCVFTQSPTHLIADVNAYVPAASTIATLSPARLLDTRPGQPTIDGVAAGEGVRSAGSTIALTVTGRGGVPLGAATVILNVTVTETQVPGYLTVFPCGIPPPLASNLNYGVRHTVPNAVIVRVGAGGTVCVFTSQATHLVADVSGYVPG